MPQGNLWHGGNPRNTIPRNGEYARLTCFRLRTSRLSCRMCVEALRLDFVSLSKERFMSQSVTFAIGDFSVRQLDGLFSLNDLHAAAGAAQRHEPNRFLRLANTKELLAELGACPEMGTPPSTETQTPLRTVNDGANNGTYACRELVIAYAAWISAAFHLKVIRVFLAQQQPLAPVQHAIAMGCLIGSHVQQIVTHAVLEGGHDYKNQRWVLSFITGTSQVPMVEKLDPNALILSPSDLFNLMADITTSACDTLVAKRQAQAKKIETTA